MEDAPDEEQEEEKEEEYDSANDQRSEHYDSNESENDVETSATDGAENSVTDQDHVFRRGVGWGLPHGTSPTITQRGHTKCYTR